MELLPAMKFDPTPSAITDHERAWSASDLRVETPRYRGEATAVPAARPRTSDAAGLAIYDLVVRWTLQVLDALGEVSWSESPDERRDR